VLGTLYDCVEYRIFKVYSVVGSILAMSIYTMYCRGVKLLIPASIYEQFEAMNFKIGTKLLAITLTMRRQGTYAY